LEKKEIRKIFHLLKNKNSNDALKKQSNFLESRTIKPFSHMFASLSRPAFANIDSMQKSRTFSKGKELNASYHAKLNSFGFRSDEFKKMHDQPHILFAGCSETFGEGGELEDSWAYKTYLDLSGSIGSSGYFNIGFPGKGYQDIINLCMQYWNTHAKPDYIMIAFPSLLRKKSWVEKEDLSTENNLEEINFKSGYYMLMPQRDKGETLSGRYRLTGSGFWHKNTYSVSKVRSDLIDFCLAVKLFEELCKEKKIKFLWTLLDTNDDFTLNELKNNFKHTFVDRFNRSDVVNLIAENPSYTLEKSDGHLGTGYHQIISNNFLKVFKDKGWDKDAKK
jgi:hypothetical protein